jgi:tRNA(Arg) A34 adenosine deaminase TadA
MADDTDDERFLRRAIELARAAAEHGNEPFGSLLVHDGHVIAESENTILTDDDITAHPELKLARLAASDLDADAREATTMYTSTEPCAMCQGAIVMSGLGRVVYSVPGERAAELTPREGAVPTASMLADGAVDTVGPMLQDAGELLHEECWGDVE